MTDQLARLAAALADRYVLERELGAGGMATVYLAHDLKHDRKVAIKVLRPELAAVLGAERFVQEIKTTANLQHPNILPLFDSGEADGFLYYVMPYVEGETLRAKLDRETQLGVEEAVRLTTEVADALEYAHQHQVIHRDVKPENILLHAGRPLVADFGIALAVSAAAGGRMTETGLSLGTPHYMSPEQATAEKQISARSDIYSLGAVLYEMLTGDPPHTGSSVQAIILKIVSEDAAPVTRLRKTVPAHVAAAVAQALEKLPADRFASAKEFAAALVWQGAVSIAAGARSAVSARPGPGRQVSWWARVAVAATLVAVVAVAAAVWAWGRSVGAAAPREYDVVLPDSAPIVFAKGSPWGGGFPALVVSPRADFVVYVADRGERTELWWRSLLDSDAHPIPGTDSAYLPAMHPDGELVAFMVGNAVKVVSLVDGTVRLLGEAERPTGIAWLSRDQLVVTDNEGGVFEFDRLGGPRRELASTAPWSCQLPVVLSAGELLCGTFVLSLADGRPQAIAVRTGDDGEPRPVFASMPVPVGSRHVVYSAWDGSVIAARWHPADRTVSERVVVLNGVRTEGVYGGRQAALSASGTLVYVPGMSNDLGVLVRADGAGDPVPLFGDTIRARQFDVSPDGRRLAVAQMAGEVSELWIYDLVTGHRERWIEGQYLDEPRWSPDGERLAIAVASDPAAVEVRTLVGVPGSGRAPDTLQGAAFYPSDWHDATALLGYLYRAILRVSLESPIRVDTVRQVVALQRAMLSPDRRLIAYMAGSEVVVETYPEVRRRYTVGRGIDPLWIDARTLLYKDGTTWYRVVVNGDASGAGRPTPWFSDSRFLDTAWRSHALTPDGDVIYLRTVSPETSTYLHVVPRWAEGVVEAVERGR